MRLVLEVMAAALLACGGVDGDTDAALEALPDAAPLAMADAAAPVADAAARPACAANECAIDARCYFAEDFNPENDCELCDPRRDRKGWSPVSPDTTCGPDGKGRCDGRGKCIP